MILGLENIAVVAMLHLPVTNRQAPENAIVASAAQIPSRWKPFQRCIVSRESHGNPHARNRSSSAQGKYQYLAAWTRPLSYMVRDRLIAHGMPKSTARALQVRLSHTPIASWSERYQDVGFAATITIPGNWRHWYQAGSPCNGYAR